MAPPQIYHPFRKWMLRQIVYSTVAGVVAAEAFWRLEAVPKVERRNQVMKLIEEERKMKRDAMELASLEQEFPSSGSYEDLLPQ